MYFDDVDRCRKFLWYVGKEMSDKAVFRDLLGRDAQLIAVVD